MKTKIFVVAILAFGGIALFTQYGCSKDYCVKSPTLTEQGAIVPDTAGGQIFVPKYFSPNGDGINDLFIVYANYVVNFKLTITACSNKFFESADPKMGWDGSYKGKQVNAGIYSYDMSCTLANGEQITQKGQIQKLN